MNNRQRFKAVLNYEPYDRLPIMGFGYWSELLDKWVREGHLTSEEIEGIHDGCPKDTALSKKLGFDITFWSAWPRHADHSVAPLLHPPFESNVLKEYPDGSRERLDGNGVVILEKKGVSAIPYEVRHTLIDRSSWEEHYLPRLQYSEERFDQAHMLKLAKESEKRDYPLGLFCLSLFGEIRNWMGVEGISYLYADDEDLYKEIIDTVGNLTFKYTKRMLEFDIQFDSGFFWEDICFKNGPLVIPSVFDELVGPHYRKITDLVKSHGINIIMLDCDGVIDSLIPTWFNNGVNTMFPIEVGTWGASILPWREKYGKELRGVGGMNKMVLSYDRAAVDAEIERLKPLVELGGYLPCPDHRLPPETKWELVQYYCDKMKKTFSS